LVASQQETFSGYRSVMRPVVCKVGGPLFCCAAFAPKISIAIWSGRAHGVGLIDASLSGLLHLGKQTLTTPTRFTRLGNRSTRSNVLEQSVVNRPTASKIFVYLVPFGRLVDALEGFGEGSDAASASRAKRNARRRAMFFRTARSPALYSARALLPSSAANP
jgi:hypothetical protein